MKQPLYGATLLIAILIGGSLFLTPGVQAQGIEHDLEASENYIKQLQVQLDAAQNSMKRNKALVESGHTPVSELTNSEAQVQQLQLQLAQATRDTAALE